MTDDEIDDLVSLVADHFGLYGRLLNIETDLTNDLGADDIDRREVLITIEELFEIRFPEPEMSTLSRLGSIINVIDKVRSQQRSERKGTR